MVIKWTKPALKNLKDFRLITQKNNTPEYIKNLHETISNLKDFPYLGTVYNYIRKNIIRKLVYKEHIILYYIESDTIYIVSVSHHKQDIDNKIKFIKKYLSKK